MATNMKAIKPTVTIMFGDEFYGYFCHSWISDYRLILPILYFGLIFWIALVEWLACSKAKVACRPALLLSTIGPPGCSLAYAVRSKTYSPITTHRSDYWLCLDTYSQVYTLSDIEYKIVDEYINYKYKPKLWYTLMM